MQLTHLDDLKEIFDAQGVNRWKVAKTTVRERIAKLKKLKAAIVRREQEFYNAIWLDFHKPQFEAWFSEVFPTLEEIDHTIAHLADWMEDKDAQWVYFLPTTRSRLHYEPKGRVLIFSPWNYPFLLFLNPIISAIAAGNVIFAKPSHKTPRVSAFLASLIEELFECDEIAVIEGAGASIGDELLKLPFDHVFFTGSPQVGAHVAELAARQHASVTLELGGKSPAVLLPDLAEACGKAGKTTRTLKDTAKKIAWGKTLNAGQTCIAPDYALCPRPLVQAFAEAVAEQIQKFYGQTPEERDQNHDFVHIVDSKACERHKRLVDDAIKRGAGCMLGGEFDIEGHYTPPIVLTYVTPDMEVMKSEIFGPILPIVAYDTLDDAIGFIQDRPKPLALYVFGQKQGDIQKVLSQTTSGSSCVNNCIVQIENLTVPFGGVGMSGTGNYHGFYGFKTFSHERNIMEQGTFDAVSVFHPPYKNKGLQQIVRKVLHFLMET